MSNVRSYTDKQLLDRVKSLSSYKQIPSNYWILGVRSNEDAHNVYDDKFYLFQGEKFIMVADGTTNAGKTALENYQKYNKNGTFVVKSDLWFYELWKFGHHNGRMPALKQNKAIIGYRDNNKDNKIDERGSTYTGFFGINFHTVSYDKKIGFISKLIGGWSAGCQVINDVEKYYKMLNTVKSQSSISFCLLEEF
tara:strand:- start:6816 stop:7397 length:582 start_codon:yes stop_codon:yes gene_type:complete